MRRIEAGAVEKNTPWMAPGCGFRSISDFNKRVDSIPAKGGRWRNAFLDRFDNAPGWVPQQNEFWFRDSLEVLKDIASDSRLASDMKWAPQKNYNERGQRIYSELWSADWWWRKQVLYLPSVI